MEDYNSPEKVAERDSQADPIVMYIIVRESLVEAMGIGKTGIQIGHAVQMVVSDLSLIKEWIEAEYVPPRDLPKLEYFLSRHPDLILYEKWLKTSYRKVALKANDREWEKLKIEFKDTLQLVKDSGLTKIPPGSETVIGLPPMLKSQRPKILKRLQAL
jgi:peptidyl-tRNA hydrolase